MQEIKGCVVDSHVLRRYVKRRSVTCSDADSIRKQYLEQLVTCILTGANRFEPKHLRQGPVRCAPILFPAVTALPLAVVSLFWFPRS